MLRNPEASRNLSVTSIFRRSAAALALGAGLASAQDFGGHNLKIEFAEAGEKVMAVMNKAPNGGRNLGYSEGPVVDAGGNLYFTEDTPNGGSGNIWKVTAAGVTSSFYNGPGMPNGLEFDNSGKMFSAELASVATYDVNVGGSSRVKLPMSVTLVADIRVNDVSVGSNGGVWFTNHSRGNQYFYRDPSGQVTTYGNTAPLGVAVPNGIEWIEEKKQLLVCSSNDNKVYSFDVGTDFKASNKKTFSDVPVPDGLTVDANGNVYVASYGAGKVYVFGPNGGASLGEIDVKTGGDKRISNCTFGGPGNKTLFMTGTAGAYKIQMKIAGRVRPGSVGIRTGALKLRPGNRSFTDGFTLAGRKVNLRSESQAALKILGASTLSTD